MMIVYSCMNIFKNSTYIYIRNIISNLCNKKKSKLTRMIEIEISLFLYVLILFYINFN